MPSLLVIPLPFMKALLLLLSLTLMCMLSMILMTTLSLSLSLLSLLSLPKLILLLTELKLPPLLLPPLLLLLASVVVSYALRSVGRTYARVAHTIATQGKRCEDASSSAAGCGVLCCGAEMFPALTALTHSPSAQTKSMAESCKSSNGFIIVAALSRCQEDSLDSPWLTSTPML